MIFDKPAKIKKRISKTWTIGRTCIEEDKIYKYLGVLFTSDGSFIEHIKNLISQRKKLRTYAKFKTEVKFENYLNTVNDFKIRRNLTQFRLGVHDLEIEMGQ